MIGPARRPRSAGAGACRPEHAHASSSVGGCPMPRGRHRPGRRPDLPPRTTPRRSSGALPGRGGRGQRGGGGDPPVESGPAALRPRDDARRRSRQEAGIDERAVSFTKGCYIGQETVARLHYKGKPNRHLRGLRLEAPVARRRPDRARATARSGTVGTAVALPRPRSDRPGDHQARGRARAARVRSARAAVGAEVVELPF